MRPEGSSTSDSSLLLFEGVSGQPIRPQQPYASLWGGEEEEGGGGVCAYNKAGDCALLTADKRGTREESSPREDIFFSKKKKTKTSFCASEHLISFFFNDSALIWTPLPLFGSQFFQTLIQLFCHVSRREQGVSALEHAVLSDFPLPFSLPSCHADEHMGPFFMGRSGQRVINIPGMFGRWPGECVSGGSFIPRWDPTWISFSVGFKSTCLLTLFFYSSDFIIKLPLLFWSFILHHVFIGDRPLRPRQGPYPFIQACVGELVSH